MKLKELVHQRYSTKKFNPEKKIPDELWSEIEEALVYTPSSINIQPWHFIVTSTEEGKKRFMKGTEGSNDYNTQKILDASHIVLFCVKTKVSDEYMGKLIKKEVQDGRYTNEELKEKMDKARKMYIGLHKDNLHDLQAWMEKQVYISLGFALLGAPLLGIDAVPMEGIDIKSLNKEFGLGEKKLQAVAMVAFGYKSEEDFNADLPKSRLKASGLITKI